MVSTDFYATAAQVIPVLVLTLILQPHILEEHVEDVILLSELKRYNNDKAWTKAANSIRRTIEAAFAIGVLAEVTSFFALAFGGAPWPVAAFVLLGIILTGGFVAISLFLLMNNKFHVTLCRLGPECPREKRRVKIDEYRRRWATHESNS